MKKSTYFDLPPDRQVNNPVKDDSPHTLEFPILAKNSTPQLTAYIGEPEKESLREPSNMADALTIYEVEPKECSIREPPVVYWLSRTHNPVSKCYQIVYC